MILALAELRNRFVKIIPNVKFAETISDLTSEDLPLVTLEIARTIPNNAMNLHAIHILVSIYADSLFKVMDIYENLKNDYKFNKVWLNCVYVEEYRGLDSGQRFIKGKPIIYGMFMLEMVTNG